ncbi:DNA polymerase IV [Nonlabens ulvanivorans]|uniref:DNA polymerase IV n=1 Tax=Nonlabens ulvanivorans TaxID=906888 RepID=UPI002943A439|nr:DNA polymerase IV [Nonlabens ulvanivorans]WOI22137.1 DNA polymerase IV [Nonlabens ulvanivorans]
MSDKQILHLDLDTFYVSVERKMDARLTNRPILVGGTSDRGVVAACSYETRGYGVHSGMSMKLAKQLCPEAVVIRGNAGIYSKHSDEVTEIIKQETPLFEKSSIDEFYADLSGTDRFYGCYKLATAIRKKIIDETGLPISFGLSTNKVVSKIATGEAKPNSQLMISEGTEKLFIAPLSIKKIPQVGDKTYQTLRHLGIKRIHTIQEMPEEMMINVLGKNGGLIWRRAQGIDNRPVVAFNERKSISTERTFNRDTIDIKKLKSILIAMTENLAFQLRRGDKLTGCINVKIKYSDFNTYTKQMRIPYCSADHILIPHIIEIFEKLYNRRLLIRLIGIKFSHIVNGHYQINLFDDNETSMNLYKALDKIREKYGDRTVMRAAGMESRTIGRMLNPFNGLPPVVLAHRKQ